MCFYEKLVYTSILCSVPTEEKEDDVQYNSNKYDDETKYEETDRARRNEQLKKMVSYTYFA